MQQINLYLDEFQQKEPVFSANMMLIINGYVLVIGVIIFVVMISMNQYKLHKIKDIKQSVAYWNNELELAKERYPEPILDQNLIKKIEQLEAEQNRNRNILKYLNVNEKDHYGVKFSEYLIGLAQVNQADVWLTKVEIAESGTVLQLTGRAQHSDALPEYINKLSELDVFQTIQFEKINIEKDREYLKFNIGVDTESEQNGLSMEGSTLQSR